MRQNELFQPLDKGWKEAEAKRRNHGYRESFSSKDESDGGVDRIRFEAEDRPYRRAQQQTEEDHDKRDLDIGVKQNNLKKEGK